MHSIKQTISPGTDPGEDYHEDFRGHSCLILTYIKGNPVHTVCGLHENGTVFITAYYPDTTKWIDEKTRREKS